MYYWTISLPGFTYKDSVFFLKTIKSLSYFLELYMVLLASCDVYFGIGMRFADEALPARSGAGENT